MFYIRSGGEKGLAGDCPRKMLPFQTHTTDFSHVIHPRTCILMDKIHGKHLPNTLDKKQQRSWTWKAKIDQWFFFWRSCVRFGKTSASSWIHSNRQPGLFGNGLPPNPNPDPSIQWWFWGPKNIPLRGSSPEKSLGPSENDHMAIAGKSP